jgi:dolichyl-phosphate beta-glucosyltransferase
MINRDDPRNRIAPRPGHPRSEPGTRSPLQWSVVIPAYNEAYRLPRYLDTVVAYFDGRGQPYEVIVVDDGSTDETAQVVEGLGRRHPEVRVIRSGRNEGKGAAVRRGMLAARGDWRLFADADGATPITEVKRLEAALTAGADVAIGSRGLADASVSLQTRPHRVMAGRLFNWVVGRTGLSGIHDSQCGFKAFTADAANTLFPRMTIEGFGFDVELLLRARRTGFTVVELAVNWADQPGSKSSVLRDGPRMMWQILRARSRLGKTG